MSDRLDRMEAVRRLAAVGAASDDPEVCELAEVLLDWIDDDDPEAVTLDAAIGIATGRGGVTWRTEKRMADRNRYVREAADRFRLDAAALARSLHRYASTAWPRERRLAECLEHRRGRLGEYLWRILKAWPQAIGTRQVQNILRETRSRF